MAPPAPPAQRTSRPEANPGKPATTARARKSPGAGRRSHAERTAETRARIMKAVVETIAELGFQRTTAAEIARRAGVTWGAVQHHFGGKEGILVAVLEDSFAQFAERLSVIDPTAGTLADRVSLFIDHAWAHFASDDYRSSFEILLNFTAEEDDDDDGFWRGEMLGAWNGIWSQLFSEVDLAPRRKLVLQHYTISVLSGLATMKMLEGPTARIRGEELALLKQTLIHAFTAASE